MTIEITGLFQDPTRRYGPLSQARLKHVLADRFDVYLRTGQLKITIKTGKGESDVSPVQLDLPEIGAKFQEMHLPGEPDKVFRTRFWFDPSGQGRVAMRHTGVVIIDDIRELFEHEMTDSILVSGLIKGFVDAEFLSPLPARAQFFEDEYLTMLLDALQEIGVELDKEITGFRDEAENERMQTLFRRATRLAREIFSQDEFMDLDLIDGLRRVSRTDGESHARTEIPSRSRPPTEHETNGHKENGSNGHGRRAARDIIRRADFDGDVRHRSRLNEGAIEININSPDFLALSRVPRSHQVAYVAMLLGKEIIAYNDSSRASDEALEKMAAYGTRVLSKGMEIGIPRPRALPPLDLERKNIAAVGKWPTAAIFVSCPISSLWSGRGLKPRTPPGPDETERGRGPVSRATLGYPARTSMGTMRLRSLLRAQGMGSPLDVQSRKRRSSRPSGP